MGPGRAGVVVRLSMGVCGVDEVGKTTEIGCLGLGVNIGGCVRTLDGILSPLTAGCDKFIGMLMPAWVGIKLVETLANGAEKRGVIFLIRGPRGRTALTRGVKLLALLSLGLPRVV